MIFHGRSLIESTVIPYSCPYTQGMFIFIGNELRHFTKPATYNTVLSLNRAYLQELEIVNNHPVKFMGNFLGYFKTV